MSIKTGTTPHVPIFDNYDNVIWIPVTKPDLQETIINQMEDNGLHSLYDWWVWQRKIEASCEGDCEQDPRYLLHEVWACEDMTY